MTTNLMSKREFAPLFWTQFLSAFNDNFLKNTLIFLILATVATEQSGTLVTVAGAIFMLPFLLLSALGGEMADKFDKAWMAERLKLFEIGGAAVAIIGIGFSSVTILMIALFYFGVISALFGPIKYGILPDHLEKSELPRANAWIEAATFIAILGGTVVASMAALNGVSVWIFGPMMMAFAFGCWFISRSIPATGSKAPDLEIDKNILRSTWRLLGEVRANTRIWRASLMAAWFWLVGAIILSLMPTLVKETLGGNEIAITTYLAVFAVAIGIGSAIAAWMSAGRLVLLPAPLGTALMAIFGFHLAWTVSGLETLPAQDSLSGFFSGQSTITIAIDLAGMAIAGAFLVVPTFAAVQHWADEDRRARVVGAANVLGAAFMVLGGAAMAGLQAFGASIGQLLFLLSILNVVAAWLMLKYLPTNAFRDFISIMFRAFYRMEVTGLENIEKAGEAPILALNHVSFLDGPLALALTDEEPVFAIDHTIAQKWWVKPFLKMTQALPLDPSKPMATRTLIKSVRDGDPLVIFPEGRITVTGSLMKVYDGAAMVADRTGSMVVPIRIDGLERSFFSRLKKGQIRRRLFPKVKVTVLEPVKLDVDENLRGRPRRAAAGAKLYETMSRLLFETTPIDGTVIEKVIATAKERGMGKLAVQDPVTGDLSYSKLLTGASVLGAKFQTLFADQPTLGVMLPNANGAIATVLGVMSAGKVPAMINFTAGAQSILSSCKAAEVKTILTSKAFVTQAKLDAVIEELQKQVEIVWLDDLRETITLVDKLKGLMRKDIPHVRRNIDDRAVILFTSGSEGTPKGVVLTHQNILSNAAQAAARIDFGTSDKVFNILPIFHSFGLTAGTILPLISGVPVYFYPSPLHYRIVPELIYSSNSTIIFGTDTFLNGYARTAHPYDFRSIRYCFAGAEPVKASTREIYMNRFGLRVLEGYGVTETAPVISINTPMFNKAGTVGKLLPSIESRLEDVPGVEEGGRLHVKGPNVMAGYLRAENPGVLEPLEDGWHDTGDIVTFDEDGFITIRGRAKRFAKIAGEMVSLAAVEQLAGDLWQGSMTAVATLPDARKGEKLVMVTNAPKATRKEFMAYVKSRKAQDLMIPADVYVMNSIPVLGAGKVDFVGVQKMVTEGIDKKLAA